jgi:UrcA family protein
MSMFVARSNHPFVLNEELTMNTTIRTKVRAAIYCLCGATTLCALQATAIAADDALPTRRVSYADLDISKPAGAKVLYRRIEAAARDVCGFDTSSVLRPTAQNRACITQAVDVAVKRVNSVALSELHSAKAIHLAGY